MLYLWAASTKAERETLKIAGRLKAPHLLGLLNNGAHHAQSVSHAEGFGQVVDVPLGTAPVKCQASVNDVIHCAHRLCAPN